MRKSITILVTILIAAGVASAKDLKTYKATYDKSLEKIMLSHGMRMTDLEQQYANSLDILLTNVKKTGNLEGTVAVTDEIERFLKNKGMPKTPSALFGLQKMQSSFTKVASGHETNKAKDIVILTSKYDKALERLQRELVSSSTLDAAKAVKAERKRALSSKVHADARALLAAYSKPKPKPKPDVKPKRPKDAKRFGKHYYKLVLGKFTWQQAKALCEEMEGDGYLVCIGSAEENEFVRKLAGGKRMWLGGTDAKHERRWVWVSGEEFAYKNWSRGEPTNSHGKEHYINMQENGRWFDVTPYNGTIKGFVCEWDR